MTRRYYSSRTKPQKITLQQLYWKLQNLFLMFRDKDYFKEKAGIVDGKCPDSLNYKAVIALSFQPFPITKWKQEDVTEDHIFDVLEFLYDLVSMPGEWGQVVTETGYSYNDWVNYNEEEGKEEFRNNANLILIDYKDGFELTKDGVILSLGSDGLQRIFDAEIMPYDEINVDSKVRNAITKWRNRNLALTSKKEAIRELADVFEWLKKTKNLSHVLDKNDESMIFDLANNFGIRHHNPNQKTNYDRTIWYSWIFHFYLATYHAVIRLLIKKEKNMP